MASPIEYCIGDIIQIAEAQRKLMRAVCAVFAIWISFFFVGLLQLGPLLVILILLMIFLAGFYTLQLDLALKASTASAVIGALLAALLSFGCIGLLIMGMVSSRAGKVLKLRGMKVGFMGVSRQNLDIWQAANFQPPATRTDDISATTTCVGCHATIPADSSVCPKCGRDLY